MNVALETHDIVIDWSRGTVTSAAMSRFGVEWWVDDIVDVMIHPNDQASITVVMSRLAHSAPSYTTSWPNHSPCRFTGRTNAKNIARLRARIVQNTRVYANASPAPGREHPFQRAETWRNRCVVAVQALFFSLPITIGIAYTFDLWALVSLIVGGLWIGAAGASELTQRILHRNADHHWPDHIAAYIAETRALLQGCGEKQEPGPRK